MKDDSAVHPVIGVILIVAITAFLAVVVIILVADIGQPYHSPCLDRAEEHERLAAEGAKDGNWTAVRENEDWAEWWRGAWARGCPIQEGDT